MTAFQDLTWKEARETLKRGVVAILPIGSTEAHGPHLPLATDVIISEEMSRRAAEKLSARGIEALVLPPVSYSVTDFSSDFAGTISIKRETAAAVIERVERLSAGKTEADAGVRSPDVVEARLRGTGWATGAAARHPGEMRHACDVGLVDIS